MPNFSKLKLDNSKERPTAHCGKEPECIFLCLGYSPFAGCVCVRVRVDIDFFY